jgi:ribosome recycling factor
VEIACYDPSTVKAVAAAVMESRDVLALVGSVNPQVDEGTGIVMVKVPKMGRERREGITALVKDAGESATQKCRGVRRDGMEGVKKAVKGGGGVGKDEGKRREKEIDAKCKEAVKDIDDIVKQRVQEILG